MVELLLLAFLATQVADVVLTFRILERGGRELNPVMAHLFDLVGPRIGLVGAKVAIVVAVLAAHGAGLWRGTGEMILGALVAFYLGIVWWNWRQLRRGEGRRA